MFEDGFNPALSLASTSCPRCASEGLVEIDSHVLEATPRKDRYKALGSIEPSVPARCPSCGLVMEWPGCCLGE